LGGGKLNIPPHIAVSPLTVVKGSYGIRLLIYTLCGGLATYFYRSVLPSVLEWSRKNGRVA